MHLKAHGSLLAANVIYAVSYDFSKEILATHIPPFAFILIRVLGACLLFWSINSFYSSKKIAKKDFFILAICGFFGVAANQLMFFEGLNNTTTIHSSVIMVGTPILVLLFSRLFLKEALSFLKILGISIGLFGALMLIFSKSVAANGSSVYGNTLILLNACSYGIYLVLVKPLMIKYAPLQVVKWVFTFGLVLVIPFGVVQFDAINWDFSTVIILKILFIIIFMTFLTYLLTIYGLGKVSPVVVSAYIYLQPILATCIALVYQKEQLSTLTVIYGILIMIGVFLISISKKKFAANK